MKNENDIKFLTKLSTVSLHALDDTSALIGSASGCIVMYKGSKFILTVAHATLAEGRWGIELEYDVEKKGIKYYCTSFSFLKKGTINQDDIIKNSCVDLESLFENPEIVDFSYALLPNTLNAFDEYFDLENGIKYFHPKHEIETNLTDLPTKDNLYSFYGHVRTTIESNKKRMLLKPKMQLNLEYILSRGDLHRFKLPEIIKDKYDYKGCSGAPIIDAEGRVVSLVVSGAEGTNILFGINLNTYKVALDVELNDFT